jgi:hypothetical protein
MTPRRLGIYAFIEKTNGINKPYASLTRYPHDNVFLNERNQIMNSNIYFWSGLAAGLIGVLASLYILYMARNREEPNATFRRQSATMMLIGGILLIISTILLQTH